MFCIQLRLISFFPKDTFLASSEANCLKIDNSTVDFMLQDEIWNTFSFDDQCKFAYGRYYTKYNGRYRGKPVFQFMNIDNPSVSATQNKSYQNKV